MSSMHRPTTSSCLLMAVAYWVGMPSVTEAAFLAPNHCRHQRPPASSCIVPPSAVTTAPGLCLTPKDCQNLVQASEQMYTNGLEHKEDDEDYDKHVFGEGEDFDTWGYDDDDEITITTQQYLTGAAVTTTPYSSLIISPRNTAVAFVKRLFAQPAAQMHPSPAEQHLEERLENHEKDVVYFPVVGFTYVRDGPHHCRALPSISNPSCRIMPSTVMIDQTPYGTWSVPAAAAEEQDGV